MWARRNFFPDAMPFLWFDRALHLFSNFPEQLVFVSKRSQFAYRPYKVGVRNKRLYTIYIKS